MLTGSLTVGVDLRYTAVTPPDLSNPVDSLLASLVVALTDGAGANQANRLWSDQRALAASSSENLDLSGVLVDVYGVTLALARVKALILAHVAGTSVLTVGNSGANAFNTPFNAVDANAVTLRPSGVIAMIAPDATGYVVTAATGDILTVAAGAGTGATYKIVVVGAAT